MKGFNLVHVSLISFIFDQLGLQIAISFSARHRQTVDDEILETQHHGGVKGRFLSFKAVASNIVNNSNNKAF